MNKFRTWYRKLKKLAKKYDVEYLISEYPEDPKESFEDGLSPKQELNEQIMEAKEQSEWRMP